MLSERIRRVSVLLLALALAVGIATHASQASTMDAKMAVAGASFVSTPDKCGSDGDSNALPLVFCSAVYCSGMAAIQGAVVAVDVLPVGRDDPVIVPAMAGRKDPPDPYPPRLAVLS